MLGNQMNESLKYRVQADKSKYKIIQYNISDEE